MAKKLKKPGKKPEETDELLSTFDRAKGFFLEHWRLFAGGAVLLILVVLVVTLWMRNLEKRENHASFLLSQGVAALKEGDGLVGEEARVALDRALEILKRLVEEYGATRNGELGRFFAGKCLSRLERYEEAIRFYEEFLSTNRKNALYRSLALQGLGFAYENQKDYEKALSWYRELAEMEGSFLRGESILAVARIHEEMGHKDEALEAYRRFLGDYPDSPESNLIERRIALVERQSS